MQEQGKIMQELGNKVMAVLEKFATANGYALVLDVSNPQTPVLWAASAIDITADIVKLYDQANPGTGAPSAAKPPAGTAPVTTRPAAPDSAPRAGSEEEVTSSGGASLRPILQIQRYNSVRGVLMRALAVVLSLTFATSVFGQAVHRNFRQRRIPRRNYQPIHRDHAELRQCRVSRWNATPPVFGGAPAVNLRPELASRPRYR